MEKKSIYIILHSFAEENVSKADDQTRGDGQYGEMFNCTLVV